MYVLAVFRSRSETLSFSNFLNRYRISNHVVSTPDGLGAICGVSVKFYVQDFDRVVTLMRSAGYMTFSGFYKIVQYGNGYRYEKIIF